jgi:thioredoxin reductase
MSCWPDDPTAENLLRQLGVAPQDTTAAKVANGQFDKIGRAPLMLETSAPSVFAVGDVRRGSIKRVASAVGERYMAVRLVHEHLAARGP